VPKRIEAEVRCVVDARNTVGESPVWSAAESALYWVDIPEATIHRWEPGSGERRSWTLPAAVGSIALREGGGLVAALRSGFHFFDPRSGRLEFIVHPEPDIPTNRLNDGKASPEGRFWAGTMDDRPAKEKVAHLYRLDTDRSCHRMGGGLVVSNGLAWSPDGRTMYHSDSRGGAIFRYDYDARTGVIGARQTFVVMQPEWGRPDGAAVDAEGCYWSCGVSAGRLNRFSAAGELIGHVPLPVTHPTMPCFGGEDLATLYVTSLREAVADDVLERMPQSGGVFSLRPGVSGAPIGTFRG
jgi:sugar lactone lactonase YvrE